MSDTFNALEVLEHDSSKRNFYPTPRELAIRLIGDAKIRFDSAFLEPSAGKGDLIYHALYHQVEEYPKWQHKDILEGLDIDCIEIDPNLRAILSDRHYRVVHDDFLTFESQKRYNVIIMNPPFDRGAEHLLKALDVVRRGGQVFCILNAETIRNPYSNVRKDLLAQLQKYGADIEFVDNAFMSAERKTDVSVALIRVTVPEAEKDSTIIEGMKEAPTYTTPEVPEQYAELVQYNQIDEWVNRFNFEVACGIRLIEEYEALKPHILRDPGRSDAERWPLLCLSVEAPREERKSGSMINDYIKQTRRKYWRAIFQQKTFTDRLTVKLLDELQDQVQKLGDYDFSVYNIMHLLVQMNNRMVGSIEQTIVNLFDDWTGKYHWSETTSNRHYYDGWRTNDCFKVGKKVIIPFNGFDDWYNAFKSYKVITQFRDIEKVFNFLDCGRTDWEGDVQRIFDEVERTGNTKKVETKYFYVTFYKKGTAHFEFKDEKLLEKFNLFAGQMKGWLPPTYGRKRYKDMTQEERKVVDSFQGEERYNEIMAESDYYLTSAATQTLMLGAG